LVAVFGSPGSAGLKRPRNRLRKIGFSRLQQPVVVVVHKNPRVDHDSKPFLELGENGVEKSSVCVVDKDLPKLVSARHHMVSCSGESDAQWRSIKVDGTESA